MTSHMGGPNENDALAGLIDLARSSAQPATSVQLAQGLRDISGRLTARKTRRRLALRSSLAFAMAATCALSVWGVVSGSRTRLHPAPQSVLAYQIEGGSVIDGGYLHESGNSGIKLFFAEGTEFILMPGARGRLRSVDSLGARLAIEQACRRALVCRRRSVPGHGQGNRLHGFVGCRG
jgi:hypothetical protein